MMVFNAAKTDSAHKHFAAPMNYRICRAKLYVSTLTPGQNGRHFPGIIFKCIFLNENVWIWTKISLKFVPTGPIHNIPVLIQIMAWHWLGNKPLS